MDFMWRPRIFSCCGSFIIRMGASDTKKRENSLGWTGRATHHMHLHNIFENWIPPSHSWAVGRRSCVSRHRSVIWVNVVACCGSNFHIYKYIILEWHHAAHTHTPDLATHERCYSFYLGMTKSTRIHKYNYWNIVHRIIKWTNGAPKTIFVSIGTFEWNTIL